MCQRGCRAGVARSERENEGRGREDKGGNALRPTGSVTARGPEIISRATSGKERSETGCTAAMKRKQKTRHRGEKSVERLRKKRLTVREKTGSGGKKRERGEKS